MDSADVFLDIFREAGLDDLADQVGILNSGAKSSSSSSSSSDARIRRHGQGQSGSQSGSPAGSIRIHDPQTGSIQIHDAQADSSSASSRAHSHSHSHSHSLMSPLRPQQYGQRLYHHLSSESDATGNAISPASTYQQLSSPLASNMFRLESPDKSARYVINSARQQQQQQQQQQQMQSPNKKRKRNQLQQPRVGDSPASVGSDGSAFNMASYATSPGMVSPFARKSASLMFSPYSPQRGPGSSSARSLISGVHLSPSTKIIHSPVKRRIIRSPHGHLHRQQQQQHQQLQQQEQEQQQPTSMLPTRKRRRGPMLSRPGFHLASPLGPSQPVFAAPSASSASSSSASSSSAPPPSSSSSMSSLTDAAASSLASMQQQGKHNNKSSMPLVAPGPMPPLKFDNSNNNNGKQLQQNSNTSNNNSSNNNNNNKNKNNHNNAAAKKIGALAPGRATTQQYKKWMAIQQAKKAALERESGTSSRGRKKKGSRHQKGLRHFSLMVCEKVEEKRVTTYNEVAECLVRDLTNEAAQQSSTQSSGKKPHDEKNIRRRVYDALNVLMAMGIIAKDKKTISWIGLPGGVNEEVGNLTDQLEQMDARLVRKRALLANMMVDVVGMKNLFHRNTKEQQRRQQSSNSSSDEDDQPPPRVELPFVLVHTTRDAGKKEQTVIHCRMSDDRENVTFDFSDSFCIIDDKDVLRKMNVSKVNEWDLQRIFPVELRPYFPAGNIRQSSSSSSSDSK